MTEADWLASTDPTPMLEFLRGKASDRKLRLLACAMGRRVWHRLLISMKEAISVIERFADGEATSQEFTVYVLSHAASMDSAFFRGLAYHHGSIWHPDHAAAVQTVSRVCAHASVPSTSRSRRWTREGLPITFKEESNQAALLRDIFGNPFRPAAFDPAWRTSTALALANGVYEDRAFDRLPILADALEDAGCDNADLLAHCRDEGEHVRGCWAVDLVLGKE